MQIKDKIGLFTFIMITSAILVNVRSQPTLAEAGTQMFFYFAVATIGFLLPCVLILSELGSACPYEGGLYVWVKGAFGEKWGFTAIFLQWIQMTILMVMVLSFIAGTILYVFDYGELESKILILAISLAVYWGATLVNLRGLKASGRISTVCVILGVAIPAITIVVAGCAYLLAGNPIQLDLSLTAQNYIPDLSNPANLAILAAFFLPYFGIEGSAAHIENLKNPSRNYPLALIFVVFFCLFVNLLGSFSIAAVVPQSDISLIAGLMQAFEIFFNTFSLSWIVPILAIMVVIGSVGEVSTWIIAPIRGLFRTAKAGTLPLWFQQSNEHGIPRNFVIFQASLVSMFCIIFALIPGVNSAFWMMVALTTHVYLIAYFIMFLTAIKLRYLRSKHKDSQFYIPGGERGLYIMCTFGFGSVLIVGIVGMFFLLLTEFVSTLPSPDVTNTIGIWYPVFLIAGMIIIVAIPMLVHRFRKPEWFAAGSFAEDQENGPAEG
jgi:amino acid transporter